QPTRSGGISCHPLKGEWFNLEPTSPREATRPGHPIKGEWFKVEPSSPREAAHPGHLPKAKWFKLEPSTQPAGSGEPRARRRCPRPTTVASRASPPYLASMRSYRAPRRKPRHGHGTEHPPRSHEHWLGDFIADDDADEALPEPVPDALVAWVDAETLEPVALDVVPREDAERALADLLITAMQQPEWGRPRRPASVAVSRPAAERLVRDRVRGLGIQVRLDEELEAWKLAMAHVLGVFATHAPDR